MTAETDIAAIDTGGNNTAAEVRTALTSVLVEGGSFWRPATVGAYDDYFDADNEVDWTNVDFGTVAWNYGFRPGLGHFRGVHVVYDDQPASDFPAYLKSLSGIAVGDYVQTAGTHFGIAQNYMWAGVVLTDGVTATSNAVSWSVMGDNTGVLKLISGEGTLTNHATYTINTYYRYQPRYGLHLRLIYQAANTFRCQMSLNGDDWTTIGADLSETFTPTHGGFVASTNAGAGFGASLFHYFHSNVTP